MHESCGIFGVYTPGQDTARLVFFALFALQHRGQECAGIAVTDGTTIDVRAAPGLVSQVFDEETLATLKGYAAIGHTNYSAAGSRRPPTPEPILASSGQWTAAVSHNGNITNSELLRRELEDAGSHFDTESDAEVVAELIVTSPGNTWKEKVPNALRRLQGAYSLAILTPDCLIVARDPMGVRPLCIGSLDGGLVVASESCALAHIGADFVRDVKPGEALFTGSEVG